MSMHTLESDESSTGQWRHFNPNFSNAFFGRVRVWLCKVSVALWHIYNIFVSAQLKWMDAAALDKAAQRPQKQHNIEKIHQINT